MPPAARFQNIALPPHVELFLPDRIKLSCANIAWLPLLH